MRTLLVWLAGVLTLIGLSPVALAWNMPVGVTDLSRDIYGLHMLIFWISVVIGVVVFGVMFYSLFRYRHSKGAKAANFHENTTVEVIWTDRKSTRLNSSHVAISYAVFCLKKKKQM